MADVDQQEKTEQPSQKKLDEAREKGQVAKSQEINSLLIFTSGLMLIYFSHKLIADQLGKLTRKIFNSLDVLNLNVDSLQMFLKDITLDTIINLLPFFLGLIYS